MSKRLGRAAGGGNVDGFVSASGATGSSACADGANDEAATSAARKRLTRGSGTRRAIRRGLLRALTMTGPYGNVRARTQASRARSVIRASFQVRKPGPASLRARAKSARSLGNNRDL